MTSPTSPQPRESLDADSNRTLTGFDRSDRIVMCCGIAAALWLVVYHAFIEVPYASEGRRWIFVVPLLWSWVLPPAIALLADMRSRRRWVLALIVYGIVLPALSAASVYPWGGFEALHGPSNLLELHPVGVLFVPVLIGLLLLPLIRSFDPRQPLYNYAEVFQSAWRIALNGLLATVLGGCVITLLYLGAQLFETIGITFFDKLFEEPVFWRVLLPITFAATLIGVQRKLQLYSVLQRSWLTLNGWMLPLASALAVTFVFALVAQLAFGLRAGTLSAAVLIGFTAVWIKLVNATWQDGSDTAPFGPRLRQILRWSLCFMLPLAALALYNVLVRVDQYGWTVSRAWAALAATLLVIYSVGYLLATLRPARFQALLASTNYAAVFFAIAMLTAFNTPVLDPRRVAADDQTARLLDGRLALAKFDFNLITYRTDQYGHARLQALADGAGADRDPQIAVFAKRALEGEYLSAASVAATARPMPEFLVYPPGRTVPRDWWLSVSAGHLSEEKTCPPNSPQGIEPCAVIFADLSGTGREDIVLYVPRRDEPEGHYWGETFTVYLNEPGGWLMDQSLSRKDEPQMGADEMENAPAADAEASSMTEDIARGAVRTAPRLDRDLVIGGVRVGR